MAYQPHTATPPDPFGPPRHFDCAPPPVPHLPQAPPMPTAPPQAPVWAELPSPPAGYKWQRDSPAPMLGDTSARVGFSLVPIERFLDWGKIGARVALRAKNSSAPADSFRGAEGADTLPRYQLSEEWQAHIGKDVCPLDPDAVLVKTRDDYSPKIAKDVDWSRDQIYRVVGLVHGYQYPTEEQ